jgi:hypothetical protein
MHEWRRTIDAVDRLVAQTIHDGLLVLQAESEFVVTDAFDDGPEMLKSVSGWRGTRISDPLARRVASATPPISVHQQVRMNLLRTLPSAS